MDEMKEADAIKMAKNFIPHLTDENAKEVVQVFSNYCICIFSNYCICIQ